MTAEWQRHRTVIADTAEIGEEEQLDEVDEAEQTRAVDSPRG